MVVQVEIVGGVRRTVQPMGGTECYRQMDGQTDRNTHKRIITLAEGEGIVYGSVCLFIFLRNHLSD